MKSLLLVGGILGFAFGVVFSLLHQQAWPICLWHGALAAVIAGLLLPWWTRAWTSQEDDATPDQQKASNPLLSSATQPKA